MAVILCGVIIMKKINVLYLSQEDIISLGIGWEDIIKQVGLACSEQSNHTAECPPKRGIHPRSDGFIHEMPAYLKKMDACGVKWVSGNPNNYKLGLPQTLGVQIVNCPETGVPLCIMDCRWITAVRTAAASAITMKYCARKDAKKIAIIGAGVQGRMHLLSIKHVLPSLETCHINDINHDMMDYFVEYMQGRCDCTVIPFKSIAEAVSDVDIIITCTQKLPSPIIPYDCFKYGMTGAGLEAARAWPKTIVQNADKVITDNLNQTLDYQSPGAFPGGLPKIYCQIGDLLNGFKKGREDDSEKILAFNLGFSGEDIAVGQHVYEIAKERGVGAILPLMEKDI